MGRLYRRLVVLLAGIVAALVLVLLGIWLGGHPSDLPAPLHGGFFQSRPVTEQALDILTSRYYRPLDRSSLIDVGLADMVASLDDPYSRYIDPASYKASNDEAEEPVTGIGIEIAAEDEGLRVTGVVEQSPASRAGLMPGDLIIKVGSTSLAGEPSDFASKLITGPAGTPVTLTILRDGVEHVVTAVRAPIVVPVASGRMLTYENVRIGYLRLTGFSEDSGDLLRTQTENVLRRRAQALILDLRGNGGGLISEAINVASIFIEHGTIMTAVERNQPRRVYEAQGNAIAADIPLVVLVDKGTASSAEIVTAALQDHGRAKVVGTHTYGKGVFQITEHLNNGGAIDLTIGQFFTPDGRNLGNGGAQQGAGITPNVDVPDPEGEEGLRVAERMVAAEVQ